jgi:hypothetical protein
MGKKRHDLSRSLVIDTKAMSQCIRFLRLNDRTGSRITAEDLLREH